MRYDSYISYHLVDLIQSQVDDTNLMDTNCLAEVLFEIHNFFSSIAVVVDHTMITINSTSFHVTSTQTSSQQ